MGEANQGPIEELRLRKLAEDAPERALVGEEAEHLMQEERQEFVQHAGE